MSVPTKSSKDDAAEGQFAPGDNVEVIEGELINLQGKIVSVEGNKIVMLPFHEDLKVGNQEYRKYGARKKQYIVKQLLIVKLI